MLAKKQRLNLRHQRNLTIFKDSTRFHSQFFLYYLRLIKENTFKVAIVISKSKVNKAVDRNKLRRLLFADYPEEKKGYELVVVLNKTVNKADFFKIKQDFNLNLKNILKNVKSLN